MKIVSLLAVLALFSLPAAQADEIECSPFGRWMISVNHNDQSSKDDVMRVLVGLGSQTQMDTHRVLGFGSEALLVVEHRDGVIPDGRESSVEFLKSIADLNGVEIYCDETVGANPRLSGSN